MQRVKVDNREKNLEINIKDNLLFFSNIHLYTIYSTFTRLYVFMPINIVMGILFIGVYSIKFTKNVVSIFYLYLFIIFRDKFKIMMYVVLYRIHQSTKC